LSGIFALGQLKVEGDVLSGGPGMCDKVWQGEGGQNWPK